MTGRGGSGQTGTSGGRDRGGSRLDDPEQVARWVVQGEVAWRYASMVLVRSDAGVVEWISSSVSHLLGYAPEDLQGRELPDLTHPDDLEMVIASRARLVAHGATAHRGRLRHRDGSWRWVDAQANSSSDADGVVRTRALSTWRDVTAQVVLAADLEASQRAFRFIAENASDVVVRGTDTGEIAWVSPSVTALAGWDPDELVGRAFVSLVHPDDAPRVAAVQAVLIDGARSEFEARVATKSGAWAWVAITVRQVTEPGGGHTRIATWRNIQRKIETREALVASNRLYRLLAENVSDVVMHIRDGTIAWVSPSIHKTFGWDPDEIIGRQSIDLTHLDDRHVVLEHRAQLAAGGTTVYRIRGQAKKGHFHWIEVHGSPFLDDDGRQDGVIVSWRIVDHHVANEAELRRNAHRDELSGLLNRRAAMAHVAALLDERHTAAVPFAVIFCDVDNFKTINDQLGHRAGDDLVREVARRLAEHVRNDDIVARLGGDEFLVILNQVTDAPTALVVADDLRRAVTEPIDADGQIVTTTMSMGVALARPAESVTDLLARADRAMYEAKRAGRNQVITADS